MGAGAEANGAPATAGATGPDGAARAKAAPGPRAAVGILSARGARRAAPACAARRARAGASRGAAARPVAPKRPRAPALSVVVPAWNEADRVCHCIQRLRFALRHLSPEIVVVDDGSTDGTAEVCAAWIASHPGADVKLVRRSHAGKGAAVYAGAAATRGDAVAYVDADLDVPAEEVSRLFDLRRSSGWDVVVGSKRRLGWRRMSRPVVRTGLSVGFSWVVRRLFRLPVQDTQTGMKMWPGPWLRAVAPLGRVRGFLFDVELLGVAAADGLRLGEVTVEVGMRRPANRIGLGHVASCLLELPRVGRSIRRIRRQRAALGGRPTPVRLPDGRRGQTASRLPGRRPLPEGARRRGAARYRTAPSPARGA